MDDYQRANLANWDERADLHYDSQEYGVDRFIKETDFLSQVVNFDRHKLGTVNGAELLHLQCHIGTDTLSWARLGATVTGIDFSSKSIAAAKQLSTACGTPGKFLVSELYACRSVLQQQFDVVYTGVGAICWLPDIAAWAKIVAASLKPGGRFYMREGHPVMWSLDVLDKEKLSIRHPYFETCDPFPWDEQETYAGTGTLSNTRTYDWNHGIAETLTALLNAGLRIDAVEEYDFCDWQGIEQMRQCEDSLWRLPEQPERLPLMWSVLATKS